MDIFTSIRTATPASGGAASSRLVEMWAKCPTSEAGGSQDVGERW